MTQKVWTLLAVGVIVGAVSLGVCGQMFVGTWDFDAYFSQTSSSISLSSAVALDYSIGDWVLSSESVFDMSLGFSEQDFFAVGILGAFSITSGAVFSPILATYEYSWFSAEVGIAGVDLTLTVDHFLYPFGFIEWPCDPISDSYILYTIQAEVDPAYVSMSFYDCCSATCFNDFSFSLSGLEFCNATFGTSVGFSCEGFEGIHFTLEGIAFPAIDWMAFDLDIFFTTQTETQKTLTLTPVVTMEEACLTLWAEVSQTGSLTITGLNIYGIGIEATWEGVTFYSASSLDPARNVDITGFTDFWEMFTISSEGDACCGGVTDFYVSTYFLSGSSMLFDWGRTDVYLDFGISSNFSLRSWFEVDVDGLIGFGLGWTLDF